MHVRSTDSFRYCRCRPPTRKSPLCPKCGGVSPNLSTNGRYARIYIPGGLFIGALVGLVLPNGLEPAKQTALAALVGIIVGIFLTRALERRQRP